MKVGTRIKIRKDLLEKNSYLSSFGINDDMEKLRGKTAIITDVYEKKYESDPVKRCGYYLDIDEGCWTWGIDMFEINKKVMEIE